MQLPLTGIRRFNTEEKMMSKVTIPTPNDKGVEIAIDVQKVAILVKSKLLNILRCLSFCSESWKLNEDKTKLKNQKDMK